MSRMRRITMLLALCLVIFVTGATIAQEPVTIEIVGWGSGQAVVYEQFMENNPDIVVTEQMMDFAELNTFYKTRFLAGVVSL